MCRPIRLSVGLVSGRFSTIRGPPNECSVTVSELILKKKKIEDQIRDI
jgi:hypothetical protein